MITTYQDYLVPLVILDFEIAVFLYFGLFMLPLKKRDLKKKESKTEIVCFFQINTNTNRNK